MNNKKENELDVEKFFKTLFDLYAEQENLKIEYTIEYKNKVKKTYITNSDRKNT